LPQSYLSHIPLQYTSSNQIFLAGLVLGTHIFGSPNSEQTTGSQSDSLKNAESSPLAAATNKIAASDIQNLILESAKAEVIEKEQREQELEALKRGDKTLALHLRGALAPGDPNYNPHHHVDDTLDDQLNNGGGDGAMYAGDVGDHKHHGEGEEEARKVEEKEDMHNHFTDALKNELSHVKESKQHIVESMHHQFAQAVESEKKVVESVKEGVGHLKERAVDIAKHGLRGAADGGQSDGTSNAKASNNSGGAGYYPYMVVPVSENYDFTKYEPLGGGRFVEYKDGDSPYAITDNLRTQSDELARSRRVHVLNAMKHVWKNYKEYAFGKDELHPISHKSTNNWGGMGTSLVDSLDTLWLMDLKDEFYEARDWVRESLSHSHVGDVSAFETTIRSLGGLLSAYDLSRDAVFLEKAEDLGSRLFKSFNTPSGLPHGSVNLQTGTSHNFGWNGNAYILAEIGTGECRLFVCIQVID
jgi:archaellum component FlaC